MTPTVGLILDIQHQGRPSKPGDMGAAYDLDGDGVKGENGEREVDLVRAYVAAAREYAETLGIPVLVLDSGEYGARHVVAAAKAAEFPGYRWAYAACHTNAGGGTYGLIRPDYRSKAGAALALSLALNLRAPEIDRVRTDPLYPGANTAKMAGRDVSTADKVGWWTRGWSCIDGIYAGPANLAGVLVEPFFLDSREHRALTTPEGLTRIGRLLVDGVVAWGSK